VVHAHLFVAVAGRLPRRPSALGRAGESLQEPNLNGPHTGLRQEANLQWRVNVSLVLGGPAGPDARLHTRRLFHLPYALATNVEQLQPSTVKADVELFPILCAKRNERVEGSA